MNLYKAGLARASALWENCFILILSMLYFKTQDQNSESTTLLHGDIGPPCGVPIVLGVLLPSSNTGARKNL